MGIFENIRDRRKDRLQKKGKDENNDGIKDDGVIDRLMQKVEPLRDGIIMLLAQKGVKVARNIPIVALVLLFAEKVLGKDVSKVREDMRIGVSGEFAATTVTLITGIVTALTSMFAKMKEQKAKGELPDNQVKALEATEEAVNAAREGVGITRVGYDARKTPGTLADLTPVIILAAVFLIGSQVK